MHRFRAFSTSSPAGRPERSTSTCRTRCTPLPRQPSRFSKGQKPKTTTTRKNGARNEPTVALPVVWITKANYKRLFTDKFLKKSDVCIGAYAKYCK